jgi:hypothetical protein
MAQARRCGVTVSNIVEFKPRPRAPVKVVVLVSYADGRPTSRFERPMRAIHAVWDEIEAGRTFTVRREPPPDELEPEHET